MILTGKHIAQRNSSFVEFEATELFNEETYEKIRELNYDGFWQGINESFDESVIIGFDEMDDKQYDLMISHIEDHETKEAIQELRDWFNTPIR